MTKLRSISCRFIILSGLYATGCQFPLGGPGQPPAGRPYMGPTTGYAPAAQQAYGGPVAIAPGTMTTFVPTTLNTGPTIASAPSGGATYFNARPGDSIQSVASLYGVPEAEIRKINNLNPGDKLSAGQLVRVPDGATAIR